MMDLLHNEQLMGSKDSVEGHPFLLLPQIGLNPGAKALPKPTLRDFEVFEVEDIVEASLNFQAQLELQELEELFQGF